VLCQQGSGWHKRRGLSPLICAMLTLHLLT
jgi:hypothetical protein